MKPVLNPEKMPHRRHLLALVAALLLVATGCALLGSPTPVPTPDPGATTEPTPTSPIADPPTATTAPEATTEAPPTATEAPPTSTSAPPTDTPIPEPTATPVPTERVAFPEGATQVTLEGELPEDGVRRFVMGVQEGQLVEVSAADGAQGQGLRFSIVGEDGTVIAPLGDPFARVVVPTTQDYTVELITDAGAVDYTLSVLIPVRVTFESGATTVDLEASLPPAGVRHYVLRVLEGQTMTLDTDTAAGQIILLVWGADGTVLQTDHAGTDTFSGTMPSTQDYVIAARSVGTETAEVTLHVEIPAPE